MVVEVTLPDGERVEVPPGGTLTLGRAAALVPRKDGTMPEGTVEHLQLGSFTHLSALALEIRDLGDRYAVRCGENPNSGHVELSIDEHAPFGHTLPYDGEMTLTRGSTPLRICLYDEDRTVLVMQIDGQGMAQETPGAPLHVGVDETEVRDRAWRSIQDAPAWFLTLVALARPLLPASGSPRPPEYRMAVRLFNRCRQLSATTTYAFNQALNEARTRVFLPEDATFGRVAEAAVRLGIVTRQDVVAMEEWAAAN